MRPVGQLPGGMKDKPARFQHVLVSQFLHGVGWFVVILMQPFEVKDNGNIVLGKIVMV